MVCTSVDLLVRDILHALCPILIARASLKPPLNSPLYAIKQPPIKSIRAAITLSDISRPFIGTLVKRRSILYLLVVFGIASTQK